MNSIAPDFQWYIAREGKQHGPLSDAEMRRFVEFGHLRTTDLIWRAGFADWMPAPVVFPPQMAPSQPYPSEHPGSRAQEPSFGRAAAADSAATQSSAADNRDHLPEPYTGPVRAGAHNPPIPAPATSGSVTVTEPAATEDIGPSLKRVKGYAMAGLGLLVVMMMVWIFHWQSKMQARLGNGSGAVTAATDAGLPKTDEKLEARYEKTPLWQLVRAEFPEWYGERMKELEKIATESGSVPAATKHMVESLVALRRKHADQALAAPPDRLRGIATAFLTNLKLLAQQSAQTCYSFISQGESSPAVIDLFQKPDQAAAIEAQAHAVFVAISDGRKAPATHQRPQKADYDLLTEQLVTLGWSQSDLQLFADPKALAKTDPGRVCKMVQDWFSAHIAIKDTGSQERLLYETLRPVVAG